MPTSVVQIGHVRQVASWEERQTRLADWLDWEAAVAGGRLVGVRLTRTSPSGGRPTGISV